MIKKLQNTLIHADKLVARARVSGTNSQLREALQLQTQARNALTWYADPLNAAAVKAELSLHDDSESSMLIQGELI